MTAAAPPTVQPARPIPASLLAALGAGAVIAIALGTYGRVHDPTGETALVVAFSGQLQLKAWFTTLAVLLAVAQLVSAVRIYGKAGAPAPTWLGDFHRLTGTLAFLFSLPIAYHCLWSIGFLADPGFDRVFLHGLFGCLFYGAFATKVLAVRSHNWPGWTLPAIGGTVFTLLVLVWATSAYWFFTAFDGAML